MDLSICYGRIVLRIIELNLQMPEIPFSSLSQKRELSRPIPSVYCLFSVFSHISLISFFAFQLLSISLPSFIWMSVFLSYELLFPLSCKLITSHLLLSFLFRSQPIQSITTVRACVAISRTWVSQDLGFLPHWAPPYRPNLYLHCFEEN